MTWPPTLRRATSSSARQDRLRSTRPSWSGAPRSLPATRGSTRWGWRGSSRTSAWDVTSRPRGCSWRRYDDTPRARRCSKRWPGGAMRWSWRPPPNGSRTTSSAMPEPAKRTLGERPRLPARALAIFGFSLALGLAGLYLVAGDQIFRIETYRVREPGALIIALCVIAFLIEWFVMDPARIWLLCRNQ